MIWKFLVPTVEPRKQRTENLGARYLSIYSHESPDHPQTFSGDNNNQRLGGKLPALNGGGPRPNEAGHGEAAAADKERASLLPAPVSGGGGGGDGKGGGGGGSAKCHLFVQKSGEKVA